MPGLKVQTNLAIYSIYSILHYIRYIECSQYIQYSLKVQTNLATFRYMYSKHLHVIWQRLNMAMAMAMAMATWQDLASG